MLCRVCWILGHWSSLWVWRCTIAQPSLWCTCTRRRSPRASVPSSRYNTSTNRYRQYLLYKYSHPTQTLPLNSRPDDSWKLFSVSFRLLWPNSWRLWTKPNLSSFAASAPMQRRWDSVLSFDLKYPNPEFMVHWRWNLWCIERWKVKTLKYENNTEMSWAQFAGMVKMSIVKLLLSGYDKNITKCALCVLPYEQKEMYLDEALVVQQLRYTGMLETVRIRRSGYGAKYTFQVLWKLLLY